KSAEGVGQPEHASVSAPAPVGFDAEAGPEALARQIARPCRGAGHAGSHEKDVHRLRRVDETERHAVARPEGDGAAGPQLGGDVTGKDFRDHFVGQEHEDDVGAGRGSERDHLETDGSRMVRVLVVSVADPNFDARVAEIERSASPQVAIPQHGDSLSGQSAGQRVPSAIYFHGVSPAVVKPSGLVIDRPVWAPSTDCSVSGWCATPATEDSSE